MNLGPDITVGIQIDKELNLFCKIFIPRGKTMQFGKNLPGNIVLNSQDAVGSMQGIAGIDKLRQLGEGRLQFRMILKSFLIFHLVAPLRLPPL